MAARLLIAVSLLHAILVVSVAYHDGSGYRHGHGHGNDGHGDDGHGSGDDGHGGLTANYYQQTCPHVEFIVRSVVSQHVGEFPGFAAGLLRMFFHDCFVRGCDGSVLLTSPNNDAERNAIPNLSLKGFEVIDAVKKALEMQCPGVVSCADTLALAARDAVSMVQGPSWVVMLGRRDGRVSNASETISLPSPFANVTELKQNFAAQGLSTKDLVVLSGGHTLGVSRCSLVMRRLYNFTGNGDTDPSLNPEYAAFLKSKCKPGGPNEILSLDEGSTHEFDTHYFLNVAGGKGLLISDAVLLDDAETRSYIMRQRNSFESAFDVDFAESMIKLGSIGVLTEDKGEIRHNCAFVNN